MMDKQILRELSEWAGVCPAKIFWMRQIAETMKKWGRQFKERLLILAWLGASCFLLSLTGIGCPIKWLTGISCAGCGMTRAAVCVLKLQFGQAYEYHPLVYAMPMCVLLFLFWDKIPAKAQKVIAAAVIVCFAVMYLARLQNPSSVVSIEPENGIVMRIWHFFMQRR